MPGHARFLILLLTGCIMAGETQPLRVYVGGYGGVIELLAFADGAFAPVASTPAGSRPSFLAVDAARARLYAIDEGGGGGRVRAFALDERGVPAALGDASSAGGGPCHVAVDASGRWVLVASYGSGTAAVLPATAAGVGEPVWSGAPGRNAHMILPAPAGGLVHVPCLGSNHLAAYALDPASGALTPADPATLALPAGSGPRHLAWHPTLPVAYLVGELDSTLHVLAADRAGGALALRATHPLLPEGFAPARHAAAHVAVHPSGRFVYASSRAPLGKGSGPAHDGIAIFRCDPATGALTAAGHETAGGALKVPRHFALTPDGAWLLAASMDTAELLAFAIDPASGGLGLRARRATARKPSCVVPVAP